MWYHPVLGLNPQIVPLYCWVTNCFVIGVFGENSWICAEIICHLLSRHCVLSSLQSGKEGSFPAWSSTLGPCVEVGSSLGAWDRGCTDVGNFFLVRVVPRGVSLVSLELCSRWEGGVDKVRRSHVGWDVGAPCGLMFCLVGVVSLAGLMSLWVWWCFLAREEGWREKNVLIFPLMSLPLYCVAF